MDAFKSYWFSNPSVWFTAGVDVDAFITREFEPLLERAFDDSVIDVTQIIIYDQVPRHIYRNEIAAHIITYFLQKALILSKKLIAEKNLYKNLSTPEWVFVMLPLRHNKAPDDILFVMKESWNRLLSTNETSPDYDLLRRFIKATYQRAPSILKQNYDPQHAVAIEAPILANKGYYCPPNDNRKFDKEPITIEFKKHLKTTSRQTKIVISISGGVDSMVSSFVIKQLFGSDNMVAAHVNYKNKRYCDEEARFVVWWCKTQLNIPIVVRDIDEIQREPCRDHDLRDTYESYTRRVRYDTYRSVLGGTQGKEHAPIVLGHNKDDVFENIFCGITHCKKYENLRGMTHSSCIDGLTFVRPMLEIPKANIRDFARRYNIPHLFDSTPAWSQRGRIRDKIVPALKDWNPITIGSLFSLSDVMADMFGCIDAIANNLIKNTSDDLRITIDSAQKYPEIVWRNYLYKLLGIQVSKGSLSNAVEKINSDKDYRIELTKAVYIIKRHDELSFHRR